MRTVDEGVEETRRCWAAQLNCAESVLRGVCYAQGVDLPEVAKKMATPFGGGVGRSEDLCGALAGGVMAIGASIGRTGPSDDKTRSYDAAGELHKTFVDRFGSSCCRALNKGDFKSSEHRLRCGKFVEESARFALDVLKKK